MKNMLIVFCLFLSSILVAQNHLEIFISPALTNDMRQTPTSDNTKVDSRFKFGYDVGLAFKHNLKKRMSIGCGIDYSKMGFSFDNELNDVIRNYTLDRYFWEVPLLFDLFFDQNRKIGLNLNLINQFFISEKSNFDEYLYGTDSPTEIRNKFNLVIQTGFSYQIDISDKLKFKLNPFMKLSLLSQQIDYTSSGYPVSRQDWSVGLKTSLALNLNSKQSR